MSYFDGIKAAVSTVTAAIFATRAAVVPRKLVQYSDPIADPNRNPFTITGKFSSAPKSVSIRGQKLGGEIPTSIRAKAEAAELWVSAADYTGASGSIEKGDLVRIAGSDYAVAANHKLKSGDRTIVLVQDDQPWD